MFSITNINSNTTLNIISILKEIKANNDTNNGKHSGTVSRIADSGLRAYISYIRSDKLGEHRHCFS